MKGNLPVILQIVIACASAITAVGGVVVSLGVLIPLLRTAKQTHTIVNQQHTDSLNYQNALIRMLTDHGLDVPIDQANPGTQPLAKLPFYGVMPEGTENQK